MQKYAFLDRDGTLIYEPTEEDTPSGDVPYQIDSLKKLKILDGVIEGLKVLIESGYKLVMISNQNGLGLKIFPRPNFERPHQAMLKIFKENGIFFEEIFICPHLPEDNCDCRKPKTGLLEEFFERNEVDMENSFVCGDRDSDRGLAKNIGIKFIGMKTNGKFSANNQI